MSAVAQVVSVDACTSSQAQPRAHRESSGKAAPGGPGESRRRTRKKRDSGAARAAVDAAGDSTDTSEEATAAADASRPKLRRKKKTRTKKKTRNSSVECLRVENSIVAPVQTIVVEVNNDVGDNAVQLNVPVAERRPNSAVTTSSIDVCIAAPEVDGLSSEPDGSSSRLGAEVVDCVCSTVGSGCTGSPSPLPQPSPQPPSTTASTSLYGQQSGFFSDVHGSLPLLSRRALDDDRRLVAACDRSSGDVRRLPKSVSLQGYQHFLSVDNATSGRHHRHRRHLTAANYRPLTGQRGRHTLSRLDVEYINRSQIFEMISGQCITLCQLAYTRMLLCFYLSRVYNRQQHVARISATCIPLYPATNWQQLRLRYWIG